MTKRYGYITNGTVVPDSRICDYRFVYANLVNHHNSGIRIEIPNDLEYENSGSGYATTDDVRLVADLNPKVMIRLNGKLTYHSTLTAKWLSGEIAPHEFYTFLRTEGLTGTSKFGYLTAKQSKFFREHIYDVYSLDKIPSDKELDAYTFEYDIEEHRRRIDAIRELITTYVHHEEGRNILLAISDENVVRVLYRVIDSYCTKSIKKIDRILNGNDDYERIQLTYVFVDKAVHFSELAYKPMLLPEILEDIGK